MSDLRFKHIGVKLRIRGIAKLKAEHAKLKTCKSDFFDLSKYFFSSAEIGGFDVGFFE